MPGCDVTGERRGRRVTLAYLERGTDAKGRQKWDWSTWTAPNLIQKKKMMSMLMGAVITMIMTNHLYIFDGKVYHQEKGGPIGLEITGVIADVVLLWYDRVFLQKAKDAGLQILLYQRYVDDVFIVAVARRSFSKGDREDERAAENELSEEMRNLGDTIIPGMLEFESDTPLQHLKGRLPVLDIEVWVGKDNIVRHAFYKKEMATKQVLMARSALPSSGKRAISVAEAVRRLKNCSIDLPAKEIASHLNTFNLQMQNSGHSTRFRGVIVARAMAVYNKSCTLSREEGKPMWRTREERQAQVEEKGGKADKTTWFSRLGYQNTLMVPASPGGELMKIVDKVLKKSTAPMGFKTLVLEDGGRSMKSDLVKSNPFSPNTGCNRADCMMCQTEPSRGKCWGSGAVYKITCNRLPCSGNDVLPTYVGETSRTLKTRGSQHLTLYTGKKDNSFLWKHAKEVHSGVIGTADFKMELLSRPRDTLVRILQEAVYIQKNESDEKTESLNSKMEYFGAEYIRPSFSKGPADIW